MRNNYEIREVHYNLRKINRVPLSGHLKMGGSNPEGQEINVNSKYFTLGGKPFIPVMGEFHYSRYPADLWEAEIIKMKAGGISIISSYIFWIHHEEAEGVFDWSGCRNLRRFVELCAGHGMYFFARIGPWCHGECRNGGLPDWLYAKCKPRSLDPVFMAYVQALYKEISQQLDGLFYKDGGPVIGIQFDNEYTDGPNYLLELKRMASKLGMEAPIYTATGWSGKKPGGSWIPRDEMIPVFAGYPDGAWDRRITDIPTGMLYFFHHIRNDLFIGNDLFGFKINGKEEDSGEIGRYPYATCELGGGMCSTYHRRPIITADDVASMALIKIGNGNNLPGYYVYHGGSNPQGKLTTLQESKDTGYPNDYTVISYDYQASIGEFGEIRPSYGKLNVLHLFLADFGERLAPMDSILPEILPESPNDHDTLRSAVRVKEDSGFIFVNNYQRHTKMQTHRQVAFRLDLSGETLVVPHGGMSVNNGSYFILPFNLPMNDALLKYSTTQLICTVNNGKEVVYFFFEPAGIQAEYVLDAVHIRKVEARRGEIARLGAWIRVDRLEPGTDCVIDLETTSAKLVKIVTLTQQESESCRKGIVAGRERLFLTAANLLFTQNRLGLFGCDPEKLSFSVYPDISGSFAAAGRETLTCRKDGIFTSYQAKSAAKEINVNYSTFPFRRMEAKYQKYLKYLFLQENNESDILQCDISVPTEKTEGLNELYLDIDYFGDVAQAYVNGELITDEFYKGTSWRIGLQRFLGEHENSQLTLLISPLRKDAKIYIEQWPRITEQEDVMCKINSIRAVPEYKVDISYIE